MLRHLRATIEPHRRTIGRVVLACAGVAVSLLVVGGSIRVLGPQDPPSANAPTSGTTTLGWTAQVESAVTGLALEEDALYVTGAQLTVFPTSCRTVDDVCTTSWRATVPDGPLSAPSVDGGRVFAGSSRGEVYAFPSTCDASGCPPEWVGVAGEGRVSQPAVNDDFVYVTSDRLYAFPAGCATDDMACPPAWTARVPGGPAAGPPALGDGLVVVASSSTRGGIVAFPAVCGERCRPVWTGRTDGPATSVAIGDGVAYVVARGGLMAFPLSCSDRCQPEWRGAFLPGAPFAPGASSPPVAAGDRVLVGDDRGMLWVFPSSCDSSRCEPIASFEVATTPLHTPVADGDVVVSTSANGRVVVVDLACRPDETQSPAPQTAAPGSTATEASASVAPTEEPCEPLAARMLGAPSSAGPAVDEEAVYAADERGTVLAVPRA